MDKKVKEAMEGLKLSGASEEFIKLCVAVYQYVKSGNLKDDLKVITQQED